MATDYDAPDLTDPGELTEDALDALTAGRGHSPSAVVDVDDTDTAESFELPGAGLSGEELTARVVPQRADEFTCTRCFLVQHRSCLADPPGGRMICLDCAS